VQRDLPRALEALLSLLAALEEYHASLAPTSRTPDELAALPLADRARATREAEEASLASEVVGPLLVGELAYPPCSRARSANFWTAVKEGVSRVVRTFGDKLAALKFAPKTAARLQAFVDVGLAG
jgi:nucleoporin NDC1